METKTDKEMIQQIEKTFVDLSKTLAGKPLICGIIACMEWLEMAKKYNPETYNACQKQKMYN